MFWTKEMAEFQAGRPAVEPLAFDRQGGEFGSGEDPARPL